MLSAREYVEIMTCRRLNRPTPTDRFVNEKEFKEIWNRIDTLVGSMAHNNTIKGFTSEDLEGFFAMNVHKCIRRGLFDINRPPFGFFKTNFTNLLRDLVKDLNKAEKNLGECSDLLDYIVNKELDESKSYYKLDDTK